MRLPQFTIRDLLWLMVVVALGIGWWLQAARDRAIMLQNDFEIEHEVNAPGIWIDADRRLLQFSKDNRGHYKAVPVQLPK
jgi:hypothetical protein